MGRKNLERLYREIEKTKDPKAAELKSALKTFIEDTKALYTYDAKGYLPPITAEKKADLIKHYKALAKALDKFIENEKEYDAKLVELVDQFAADASWDFNSLLRYDPAKGLKSTATLEEENQPLRLKEPDSGVRVGGSKKRSMKVAGFLDHKGNELRGVCMNVRTPTPTENVMKGLSELANSIKDGEFKKSFQQFVNDLPNMPDEEIQALFKRLEYPQKNRSRICNDDWRVFFSKESALVRFLLQDTYPEHEGSKTRTVDSVAESLAALSQGKWTADEVKKNIGETALERFKKLLSRQELPPLNYVNLNPKPEGTQISNGSIGVYIMANLLGAPEIVPPTTRATLVDEEGKESEVIFMQEATGVDFRLASFDGTLLWTLLGSYCTNNLKETNGTGVKAGMDMQMLSNICHLFDRGHTNQVLQFDKDGTWIGGQLIDTDDSFDVGMIRGACRAVTEPMAQKLAELNKEPEMLKFALWCCTSKDKRNATAQRIKNEVDRIEKSKSHYEKFDSKRNDKEMYPCRLDLEGIDNPYSRADNLIRVIPLKDLGRMRKEDVPYLGEISATYFRGKDRPAEKPENLDLTKYYCKLPVKPEDLTGTKRRTNAVGLLDSQKELIGYRELLDDKEEYRAMQKALGDLISYQDGLLQRLNDPKTAREKPITSMELIEIKERNLALEECAWDYLYTKFGKPDDPIKRKKELIEDYRKTAKGNFRSDYEKERVDAALTVLEMAQKGQNIDDEKEIAAYNTVQSMERKHYKTAAS